MFRLDGRVALVTGAASGIGAATARVFAEAGADIVAGWYPADPHDVEPTRAAVEGTGRRCVVCEVDVSDTSSVDAMVVRAVEELGRLDVVVANAAIARDVPSPELDDERWNALLQVDLYGVFHARKLKAHELALRAGWDRMHAALGITKPFYDRFTPAISARDFVLRREDLDRALDFVAVLR